MLKAASCSAADGKADSLWTMDCGGLFGRRFYVCRGRRSFDSDPICSTAPSSRRSARSSLGFERLRLLFWLRTSRLRYGMLFRSFVHAFWQSERNSMDCCGASFSSKAKYQAREPCLRLSIRLCCFFHTMSAKRAFRLARSVEIVRMLFVGLGSGLRFGVRDSESRAGGVGFGV